MDETSARATGRDDQHTDGGVPLVGPQPVLPFDDGTDEPIGYRLTARARRTVAPESLPALSVVGRPAVPGKVVPADDGDLERPGDTRPARARALRRAGLSTREIARQLEVDPLLVDVWVADVRAPGRGAATATARRPGAVGVATRADGLHADGGRGDGLRADGIRDAVVDAGRAAAALARADAARTGRARLDSDPDLAAGVGLLAGLARIDEHAISVTAPSPEIAAAVLRFATRHLGVARTDVAVVVRLGPRAAGDLARHRWAAALGLTPSEVAHARWRGAPSDEAEQAIVRLADPAAAATLAGWCDALLEPTSGDLDVAF